MKRRRRRNPSLHDIDETTQLLLIIGGGVVLYYFGSQIFSALQSLLGLPGQIASNIGQGVISVATYESPSQTANTDGTGNEILDSLGVGAAGGG